MKQYLSYMVMSLVLLGSYSLHAMDGQPTYEYIGQVTDLSFRMRKFENQELLEREVLSQLNERMEQDIKGLQWCSIEDNDVRLASFYDLSYKQVATAVKKVSTDKSQPIPIKDIIFTDPTCSGGPYTTFSISLDNDRTKAYKEKLTDHMVEEGFEFGEWIDHSYSGLDLFRLQHKPEGASNQSTRLSKESEAAWDQLGEKKQSKYMQIVRNAFKQRNITHYHIDGVAITSLLRYRTRGLVESWSE